MLVQEMPQRTHGHLQKIRGARLIAVGALESFEHVSLLKLIEMRGEIDSIIRQLQVRTDARLTVVGDLLRQTLRLNHLCALESDGAFDGVFELAHVAWP